MAESLRGRLLVASPVLADPNFARAVVLLLEHDESGALGVVLNRSSETPLAEVLPQWTGLAAEPGRVFVGGPVEPQAALCLAVVGPGPPPGGFRPVTRGLGVLDLDLDPDVANAVRRLRVFAGYAGWRAGQLEEELSLGGWYVVEGEPEDAVTGQPGQLWRAVLRRQPGSLALLASYPADPRLN